MLDTIFDKIYVVWGRDPDRKEYIENHLREYKKHKSITPIWCGTCHALIEYNVEVDINQTLGYYEKA